MINNTLVFSNEQANTACSGRVGTRRALQAFSWLDVFPVSAASLTPPNRR